MIKIKQYIKKPYLFICDQYIVLYFIVTSSLKLAFFNTFILKATWPTDQYQLGLMFGFLSSALLFSPLYLINKNKQKTAIIVSFILSIVLTIDTVYYSYFSTIPSIGIFSSIGQTGDVSSAIIGLINWSLLLYFTDIIFIKIFSKRINVFFNRIKKNNGELISTKKIPLAAIIVTILITINGLFLAGIEKVSQTYNSAYDTSLAAQYYGVIGAYAIDIARFIDNEITNLSDIQKQSIYDWVKDNKPDQIPSHLSGIAKDKNIIIIQVESLGSFVINKSINNKPITPTLNKLTNETQYFPNDRFEIGAGHTSDTDLTVNTSMFPLNDAAVFIRYGQDDFLSLPKILAADNYSTHAYHGFSRNFWNRSVALESLGYQKFFAADNYPKGPIINMGLNDGDFLNKTADYIIEQPKPSFSYVITLSSHTGFEITELTKDLGLNPDDYPSQVAGYLEDINYVDRMIGKFLDKLKLNNLYDDSLIVIYGDHTPVLTKFEAGDINYDPETIQSKEVPLFFKLPNNTEVKTYTNKGTHLDIMPSILDLLGIKTNQLMFGQSLFNNYENSLPVCNNQMTIFRYEENCESMILTEKIISEKIIRYNLFDILPK